MWPFILACKGIVFNDPYRIAFEAAALAGVIAAFALRPGLKVAASIDIASRFVWIPAGLFLLAQVALYAIFPFLYDHGDVAVASIGAAMRHGQVAYSGLNYGSDFYSLAYGPLLYQVQSAVTAFWPSIFASKLPGLIAFVIGITAVIAAFPSKTRAVAGPLAALLAIILIRNGYSAYGVRAESLLLGLTAASTFAVLRGVSWRTALFVGAVAGIAAGLKITACLFMLPHALAIIFADRKLKVIALNTAALAAGAITAFVLPLLAPGVNLQGYAQQLMLSTHVGYSFAQFLDNTLELAVMTAPPLAVLLARQKPLKRSALAALLGLAIAGVLMIAVASKLGSGPFVLLPFLPVCVGLFILFARELPAESEENICRSLTIAAVAVTIAYTPFLAVRVGEFVSRLKFIGERSGAVAEAQQLYSRYPDAQMGVSDEPTYDLTAVRMLGPLHGARLQFDVAAWMEFAHVEQQRAEAMSLVFVKDCRVAHWILPSPGAPFIMRNYYQGAPFFTPAYAAAFKQNYAIVEQTPHFTVWACHSN